MKEYQQEKNKKFRRIKKILLGVFILLAIGLSGYLLSLVLFVEAQVSLPIPTSPPLSCTGCHSFQARLFGATPDPYIIPIPYHHPNAISFGGGPVPIDPIDMVPMVNAVRQDCCACHNYQISHTSGIVMLKDPDPVDRFLYNGDPIRTNNFCLSCHDEELQPVGFNIINGVNRFVSPEGEIAGMWCFPCAHAVYPIPTGGLRCLDCHKYHGSVYKGMLKKNQPDLCYMNGCHPEKATEFHVNDPLNESHHHVEGVILSPPPPGVVVGPGPYEANILECCDCHNPHHNTRANPISDPYSNRFLYPVEPEKLWTVPVKITLPPPTPSSLPVEIYETVDPFFVGQTNLAGVPLADLFCLECHAPNIFIRPDGVSNAWLYAPNITEEITNRYYNPLTTISNFFYSHGHNNTNGKCKDCHDWYKIKQLPNEIINGHYTHLKNASCTYCHDPHGTPGTYVGLASAKIWGTIVGGLLVPNTLEVQGIDRGHLLGEYYRDSITGQLKSDPWLLTTFFQPGSGYFAPGIYPSPTSITRVEGASSCFANNRLNPLLPANEITNGCHNISHVHTGLSDDNVQEARIRPQCICNIVACHQPFEPLSALPRKGDKTGGLDELAPAPPK